MLLRFRSRAVTSKQAPMADQSSHSSQQSQNYYTTKIPSFFDSPRFRAFFTIKGSTSHSETDQNPMISPTSILDTKLISLQLGNPFSCDKNQPQLASKALTKHCWDNSEATGIGLALVDTLVHETSEVNSNTTNSSSSYKQSTTIGNKVLFGNKLRVQIPPYPAKRSAENHNSDSISNTSSPQAFTRCVSVREMEMSEDYTCVISRGANPRTTHIFNNCIVDSCFYTSSDSGHLSETAPENFLSFCHTCKKNLEQKIDI